MTTMETLNLGGGAGRRAEFSLGFRSGWLKKLEVAIYGAGGMALAAGAYEVFRNQPDKSFQLLQVWGPAFLVALVGIYVYGRITESQIQATRESFGELAASIRGAVEASAQTAAAMNRMAEVSGETNRETQRLAMFAAQQGQEITDRLDRQDEVLSEIMHSMKGVHSMLSKEKAALDAKEKEIGGTV